MKVIFMGTPSFSVPVLQKLLQSKHQVVGVVCAQDASKRGKPIAAPVKVFALQNNLPLFQPERISSSINMLDSLNADIIVTCAFGQLLKQNVLDYCKYGVINVHPSLLPLYRGSSPVQWAIIEGQTTSGCTVMHTDIGMDSGDIILQEKMDINDGETADQFNVRVFDLGANMLVKALDQLESGTATRTEQDHSKKTYHPMLTKEHGKLDFNKNITDVINLIRGLNSWPLAFCTIGGKKLSIYSASKANVQELDISQFKNGQIGLIKKGLFVVCGGELLRLDTVCLEGKSKVDSGQFVNGFKVSVGDYLI